MSRQVHLVLPVGPSEPTPPPPPPPPPPAGAPPTPRNRPALTPQPARARACRPCFVEGGPLPSACPQETQKPRPRPTTPSVPPSCEPLAATAAARPRHQGARPRPRCRGAAPGSAAPLVSINPPTHRPCCCPHGSGAAAGTHAGPRASSQGGARGGGPSCIHHPAPPISSPVAATAHCM
jgi:hypothetical protein